MATAIEKLMYKISMIDNLSQPAKKVEKVISGVQKKVQTGMRRIAVGAAGLAGAGYTTAKLVDPAIAMNKALGSVASLDVPQAELDKLQKTATRFTLKYGGNAAEIVASSYDIQSAINGLRNGELAAFTNASAILAKATKSDTATITSYMGTMYGVFKDTADRMGRAKWVDQLTGQTAQAVKMFKTTGPQMADAVSNVGATGSELGVSMGEQLAIVGKLQTTMAGAEAGTRYVSFLQGLGEAGDRLHLKFTDQSGNLMPTVKILELIDNKLKGFSAFDKQNILKKAFGRKEAVAFVQNLTGDVDGLASSINQLKGITGLGPAEEMARKMTVTTDRLGAAFRFVHLVIANASYKALAPFLEKGTRILGVLAMWLQEHPRLAAAIGVTTLAVIALVAAFSAFTLAMGIASLISAGITALQGLAAATWLLNIAMYANPIGLIVAGIVAFIAVAATGIYLIRNGTGWMKVFGYVALAALGPFGLMLALVITYWDQLKRAVVVTGKVIAIYVGTLWRIFTRIASAIVELFIPMETLAGWWQTFSAFALEAFQGIRLYGGELLGWLGNALTSLVAGWFDTITGLLSLAANLPGIGKAAKIALEELGAMELKLKGEGLINTTSAQRDQQRAAASPSKLDIPPGGLRQSFNQSSSGSTYGDVYISSQQSPSPAQLEEWMSLQYG